MFRLEREAGEQLRSSLDGARFEFRQVPHAVFGARGEGVTATLYESGKLVLQGADLDAFVARFLPGEPQPTETAAAPAAPAADRTTVGTDESGKGDYFGPLVVAGVRLEPELARKLTGGEVRDCKRLSDTAILRVGGALRQAVPFAVQRLDPPEYNASYGRIGNLNPLLAGLHARVIEELAGPGMRVVVDRFAAPEVLETALEGSDLDLEQHVRGEEADIAVAAASVIAREEFLIALADLSEAAAIELSKGAGDATERAARDYVRLHGAEALGRVAKLHFRTTDKVLGRRAP